MTMADYLPILFMLVVGLIFAIASMIASRLLAPNRPTKAKLAAYECGIVAEKDPPERFPVRFYMVAMLFILFDIEIVFMYPWAVAFKRLALFGFIEMGIFVVTLLIAYVYIWREGILDWSPHRLKAAPGETAPEERKAA